MKERVAVIFGGKSSEHEVSLLSAASVIRAIDKDKFDLVYIGITKDGLFKSLMIELYDYEGELYYFIVSIGDGKPEDKGYYFIKIEEDLQEVFRDVIN